MASLANRVQTIYARDRIKHGREVGQAFLLRIGRCIGTDDRLGGRPDKLYLEVGHRINAF